MDRRMFSHFSTADTTSDDPPQRPSFQAWRAGSMRPLVFDKLEDFTDWVQHGLTGVQLTKLMAELDARSVSRGHRYMAGPGDTAGKPYKLDKTHAVGRDNLVTIIHFPRP